MNKKFASLIALALLAGSSCLAMNQVKGKEKFKLTTYTFSKLTPLSGRQKWGNPFGRKAFRKEHAKKPQLPTTAERLKILQDALFHLLRNTAQTESELLDIVLARLEGQEKFITRERLKGEISNQILELEIMLRQEIEYTHTIINFLNHRPQKRTYSKYTLENIIDQIDQLDQFDPLFTQKKENKNGSG